jgi:predicted membrane channel-forming protein YqfA (hemolysin III family)
MWLITSLVLLGLLIAASVVPSSLLDRFDVLLGLLPWALTTNGVFMLALASLMTRSDVLRAAYLSLGAGSLVAAVSLFMSPGLGSFALSSVSVVLLVLGILRFSLAPKGKSSGTRDAWSVNGKADPGQVLSVTPVVTANPRGSVGFAGKDVICLRDQTSIKAERGSEHLSPKRHPVIPAPYPPARGPQPGRFEHL